MTKQKTKPMTNRIGHVASTIIVLALTAIQCHAQAIYEPYSFTTLAGNAGYGDADGTGSEARFNHPVGVAADSAGNVYVADSSNQTIRKVTSAGVVTTLARLIGGYGSTGLAVDSAGTVYVADGNSTISRVTSTGVVTALAGSPGQFGSTDGTGSEARFGSITGVAVDKAGNVYVADSLNSTIRKVTPAGVVTTVAGMAGIPGSADGLGSTARFDGNSMGVAVDTAGNVYVGDSGNSTVRKMTPVGTNWVVTTLAGSARRFGSTDGKRGAAQFYFPHGVAVDGGGNVYVADYANNTIRKVTAGGVVTTLAGLAGFGGSADGTGSDARFGGYDRNCGPTGVAVDSTGNVYVADSFNNTVRKVTSAGEVTTLAGLAGGAGSADAIGTRARFRYPDSVALDNSGTVYVADSSNNRIRKMTPEGVVTTLAGLAGSSGSADGLGSDARFSNPSGVAVDKLGNVYVADSGNFTIRRVTPAGVVTTLAGLAGSFGSVDGLGSDARFGPDYNNSQMGVAVDMAGIVYVADARNATIRKVTPVGTNWVVTTLAGLAGNYGSADGIGSDARFGGRDVAAQLTGRLGVAVDSAGMLYVADFGNGSIRKITPQGVVTTLAQVYGAAGIALDSAGNIYVACPGDWDNPSIIQKVTPAGMVTTLAGLAESWVPNHGSTDGTGSNARFNNPLGITVDSAGNVYVADSGNNTIRKGFAALTIAASGQDFGFSGNQFGFKLTGPTGKSVVLEFSNDLILWHPLWTNSFVGPLKFTEPRSGVSSKRFYRARLP